MLVCVRCICQWREKNKGELCASPIFTPFKLCFGLQWLLKEVFCCLAATFSAVFISWLLTTSVRHLVVSSRFTRAFQLSSSKNKLKENTACGGQTMFWWEPRQWTETENVLIDLKGPMILMIMRITIYYLFTYCLLKFNCWINSKFRNIVNQYTE